MTNNPPKSTETANASNVEVVSYYVPVTMYRQQQNGQQPLAQHVPGQEDPGPSQQQLNTVDSASNTQYWYNYQHHSHLHPHQPICPQQYLNPVEVIPGYTYSQNYPYAAHLQHQYQTQQAHTLTQAAGSAIAVWNNGERSQLVNPEEPSP